MVTGLKKYNTTDYELSKVQDNVADAFTPLFAQPWVNGTLVKTTLKANADTSINTGLGLVAQGWLVLSVDKPCEIWLSNNTNSSPTKTLLLANNAPHDVAVTLWIF